MFNNNAKLLTKIFRENICKGRFFLVDVGCSGGIAPEWFQYGPKLDAIGFDPLVAEINRLRGDAQRVEYIDAFVGARNFENLFPERLHANPIEGRSNYPYTRTSSMWALDLLNLDYVKEQFNVGQDVKFSDRRLSIDEYFSERAIGPDFIKIDTDGNDYPVLIGSKKTLEKSVLGVLCEVQFHGNVHPYENLFSNIDSYLRGLGFTLFKLESYNYSRKDLPSPFIYDLTAQTRNGQTIWGEALYVRDLGDSDYEKKWAFDVTLERILKTICLFELFHLQDCAVEVICKYRGTYSDLAASELLDMLTPTFDGDQYSYEEYLELFKKDPRRFFPSNLKKQASGCEGMHCELTIQELKDRVAHLERELTSLRASTSWKVTEPIRNLVNVLRKE